MQSSFYTTPNQLSKSSKLLESLTTVGYATRLVRLLPPARGI
jgi:hypothetical protein